MFPRLSRDHEMVEGPRDGRGPPFPGDRQGTWALGLLHLCLSIQRVVRLVKFGNVAICVDDRTRRDLVVPIVIGEDAVQV